MRDLNGTFELLDVCPTAFRHLLVNLQPARDVTDARDADDNAGEGWQTVRFDALGDVDVVSVQPDLVALDYPRGVHDWYPAFQCTLSSIGN